MTYRERRLRKAERLRGWSASRRNKADASFNGAMRALDGIEPGQPILVGHHSERHHRRAIERHDSRMRAGLEHQQKANVMASRADEIERQAERAIYSDDVDAFDRMRERIADLEAKRARMKTVNAAVRKHGLQRLVQPDPPFVLTEDETRELCQLMALCPYHKVEQRGFPSYALQNLSGNIARNRARLTDLQTRAAQRARVSEVLAAETPTDPNPQ